MTSYIVLESHIISYPFLSSLPLVPMHTVGGIMICYVTHLLSPVQRARKCPYGCLVHHILFTLQNLRNYTREDKIWISEVFQISSHPSQKIQLILMILTVLSLFPYLLWGMRNGTCHFHCLHAFLRIPWTYLDI